MGILSNSILMNIIYPFKHGQSNVDLDFLNYYLTLS